jgi:Predicted integral membrane protein (DUF2269)
MIIEKQLWIRAEQGSPDARVLVPPLATAKNFIMAGVMLFLVSGLLMLGAVHWVFFSQPWFIAKICLFVLLPARGALVAKPIIMKIGQELNKDVPDTRALPGLKKRMRRFHLIQYSIVSVILFLVIFKI